MCGHKAVVIVYVEFLSIAEVSAQLAGMGGGDGHDVAHLDGITHFKHQTRRDSVISTCSCVGGGRGHKDG